MTHSCERLLSHLPWSSRTLAAQPLPSVPGRLLVVKVHGMGDAVLVRAAIQHLRDRNSSIKIGVLAGDATREVLTIGADFSVHHYAQKELTLRSAFQSIREIKSGAYDAVLNFEQGSLAGTSFLRATGIPNRIGFVSAHENVKHAFLTHAMGFQASASMWHSFLRLTRLVDPQLPASLMPLPLPLSDAQLLAGRAWLDVKAPPPNTRRIAFHLGSGSGQPFKRWPVANFARLGYEFLARSHNQAIILTGQPLERGLLAEFRSRYDGDAVDATGVASIAMTASILRECDLLVSNDTGVMHLGAAMGTPTVGLFGPTAPAQWAPSGPRTAHAYGAKVTCSPCINSYLNLVPTHCANSEYARCMADVSVESVFNAARSVVAGRWLD
jgi:ADP-heptose:LPS heptosyltransferase